MIDLRKLTAKILVEEFGWDFFQRKSIKDPPYFHPNKKDRYQSELLFDSVNKDFYEKEDKTKRYNYEYADSSIKFDQNLNFIFDESGEQVYDFYLNGKLVELNVDEYVSLQK